MPLAPQILANRSALEDFSRRHASGVYYGDHRLLCRLLGDTLAFVDTRDLMLGPRLVLDGFWESWVTLAIARYLKPGMHCIDVGANYGYYTLLMASAVGPTGRVLACEPNPILAETYLPQNLALNGFHHGVDICPKVVSGIANREVDFILHKNDFATSSMAPWSYDHREQSLRVPTTTIDELCCDWPRLDLIKIDAEGSEGLVWNGMEQTRKRFPQAAIVIELHLPRDTRVAEDLLVKIQDSSYTLQAIQFSGDLAESSCDAVVSQLRVHWTLWLSHAPVAPRRTC